MEQTKKKFLKNMVSFSMMSWITFVIGFIASPVATRLFVAEEKGKIDMFMQYAAMFSSICYMGLDQAYVRFFSEPPGGVSRKVMLTFCTAAPLAVGILGSLALLPLWPSVSGRVNGTPDIVVYACLCVYCAAIIIYRFSSLAYRMEQNARMYTLQGVLYVLITKFAYLIVAAFSPTGKAAIVSLPIMIGLFLAVFLFKRRDHYDLRGLRSLNKPFVASLTRFSLPLVPLSVLSTVNASASVLVLKRLLDLSAVGIFTTALALASSINIIQTGFNTYWAPYVFENYKDESSRRFFTVHKLMACLLAFFGLIISLMQAPVFLLLAESYRSSVVFFPFLFLSPICYCLGETTGMGINIAKKTYWTTIIFVFSVLVNVGLCFLLVPRMGMAGAAVASAFTGILTLLLRTVIGNRYYRVLESYRYLLSAVGLMLVASFGNLLLSGWAKYALLLFTLGLAFVAFRSEVKILWTTARQIAASVREKLASRRGKGRPHA